MASSAGAPMAKSGGGTIVNGASALSYVSVVPGSAVYAPAKRYVWYFSRAVNYENERSRTAPGSFLSSLAASKANSC